MYGECQKGQHGYVGQVQWVVAVAKAKQEVDGCCSIKVGSGGSF